jgi:hypothetical protein
MNDIGNCFNFDPAGEHRDSACQAGCEYQVPSQRYSIIVSSVHQKQSTHAGLCFLNNCDNYTTNSLACLSMPPAQTAAGASWAMNGTRVATRTCMDHTLHKDSK